MSAAILFALGALVLNGLGDFVFKQAARGPFKTHQFIVAQSACFCLLSWSVAYATGSLVFSPALVWGLVAGVFMFVGFNSFALSLQDGNVSINAPIFRLNFIVTAMLAVAILAETVTAPKLAGLAFALAAVWLLVGAAGGTGPATAASQRSLALVLVATLALGAGNMLHKIGISQGGSPAVMLACHSSVFLTLAAIVAVRHDGGLKVPATVWPYAVSGAAMTALGFVMMLQGLALGEASVIVPIAQMGLVVSALLGVVVLGEAFTARKGLGLLAAIAALAMLAAS